MTKKINIKSKPTDHKKADDWVTSTKSKPESAATKRLTIDITPDLHTKIKIQCAQEGVKMSDAIREILQEKFN